jgi:hypothetical protein
MDEVVESSASALASSLAPVCCIGGASVRTATTANAAAAAAAAAGKADGATHKGRKEGRHRDGCAGARVY